jgi:hypothetical protein
MRRAYLGLAAALAIATLASPGRAHGQATPSLGSDPFSLYFGFYLPHQAAIAAQPTPMDTINHNVAQRQATAQTDRASLYDPISPYGDEDLDPLAPYSGRRGLERRAKVQGFTYGASNESARGTGPSMYYNRTARYFPSLRVGRGPNQNLARVRSGRGGMGGGGMPSMPSMPSMPGPR